MYAEEIVNRTIEYYRVHGIALIEKRMVPIKIIKNVSTGVILGKLLSKSLVDYCGCYHGQHIEFEVKETANDGFSLNQLQTHQFQYLKEATRHSHWCFLIVYFTGYEEFYLIHFTWIQT
jgi:recombination protein U